VAAGRAAALWNVIVKLAKVAEETPETYFNTKGKI
jgi:hypothetical protein